MSSIQTPAPAVPCASAGPCHLPGPCRPQKTLMSPILLPQGVCLSLSAKGGWRRMPYLSLHSQVKSPTLEGQHGFVLVPGAFRENQHSDLHRTGRDVNTDPRGPLAQDWYTPIPAMLVPPHASHCTLLCFSSSTAPAACPLTFSRRMVLAVCEMTPMASPLLWRSMKMMPLSQQAHPTVPMYMSSFLAMGTQRSGITSTMPGGEMGEETISPCLVAPMTNKAVAAVTQHHPPFLQPGAPAPPASLPHTSCTNPGAGLTGTPWHEPGPALQNPKGCPGSDESLLSPALTHEVKGSLVVANYHIGLLGIQMLGAPHLHLDAVQVLEGPDRSTQEPRAEEHVWGADQHREGLLDFFQPFTVTQEQGARWIS